MKICFIPNLGTKRVTNEPKWGAEFFADAFQKYSPNEVTVEYTLNNLNEYDLIWVHNVANLLKGIPGRANLVKTLLKVHPPLIGGVRGEVGFDAARHYLRFFDAIHTSNQRLTEQASQYKSKSHTLSSGVDPSWFTPHPTPETFSLGWAGDSKKNMKNVDIINTLPFPMVWATKDNYIPHNDMPKRFYHKINALVHPSSHEGSCRVITEAAACGLPIICTNVGHNDTLVHPDWMFSLNKNARSKIIHLLTKLKENPELAYKVGSENRERARIYSWPSVIERAHLIIDQVLENQQ